MRQWLPSALVQIVLQNSSLRCERAIIESNRTVFWIDVARLRLSLNQTFSFWS
jgi:hypothetical protein